MVTHPLPVLQFIRDSFLNTGPGTERVVRRHNLPHIQRHLAPQITD